MHYLRIPIANDTDYVVDIADPPYLCDLPLRVFLGLDTKMRGVEIGEGAVVRGIRPEPCETTSATLPSIPYRETRKNADANE